jgi:hypothetical protein
MPTQSITIVDTHNYEFITDHFHSVANEYKFKAQREYTRERKPKSISRMLRHLRVAFHPKIFRLLCLHYEKKLSYFEFQDAKAKVWTKEGYFVLYDNAAIVLPEYFQDNSDDEDDENPKMTPNGVTLFKFDDVGALRYQLNQLRVNIDSGHQKTKNFPVHLRYATDRPKERSYSYEAKELIAQRGGMTKLFGWVRDLTRECIEPNPGPRRNGRQRRKTRNKRNFRKKLPAVQVSTAMNGYANFKSIMANEKGPKFYEGKYIETQLDGNVVGNWTIVDCTAIAQGTGDTNRIGRWVRLKQLQFNFSLNAQNADIFTNTRIVILQWRPQSNNQVINMANVFQTNNYVFSPYNADGIQGFHVLYDSFSAQSGTGSAPTVSGNLAFDIVINSGFIKNLLFAALTTSSFNKIYFCYISDSSLIPFPSFKGVAPIGFQKKKKKKNVPFVPCCTLR